MVFACDFWDAEVVKGTINASALGTGNELRFCVSYTVNPEEASAGTDVRFWTTGTVVPCGSLWNKIVLGGALIACDTSNYDEMYFPYVLTQSGAWSTGIAITIWTARLHQKWRLFLR